VRAFIFTVAGVLGCVVTLLAVVYVPIAFAYAGYATDFERFISWARWPLLALMALFLLTCLYRYGPSRRSAKWRWVTAGSVFATLMWLIVSAGFSYYVSGFANYDKIYGSLGAVIVLLFWLYLSFYVSWRGAETKAGLEQRPAQAPTEGKPKPMGERDAFVADHVAGGHQGHIRPVPPWRKPP